MYSDQKAENSDTFLRGAGSLEGLLAANGVSLGFSGHAHIYQRNVAPPGGAIDRIARERFLLVDDGAQPHVKLGTGRKPFIATEVA